MLLSIGPTEKQIARLTDTKGAIVTRVGAVLNMGGSHLLYLLYIVIQFRIVELCRVKLRESFRHSHKKLDKPAVFGLISQDDRTWK